MKNGTIEQKTYEYFQSGFSCAEAILKSILEFHAVEVDKDIPKMASGFCGGIGKTCEDVCGAVTGGVLALGYLYGRTEPDADYQNAWELAGEFRKRFVEKYNSSQCADIINSFGEQENMVKCKQMTAAAAVILSDLIKERHP